MFGIWGLVVYRWKGLVEYLSNGILHAPKRLKITITKQKKQKFVII